MLQQAIRDVLALSEHASPEMIDRAFRTLVDQTASSADGVEHTVPETTKQQLRDTMSQLESRVEAQWARNITTSDDPEATLAAFPHHDRYAELAAHEMALFRESGLDLNSVQRCLIIGSGALPMTAIHWREYLPESVRIDHVDNDPAAHHLCEEIIRLAGGAGECFSASGQDVALHEQYDIVMVAALAGTTLEDKQAIVDNILPSLAANGRLLVRSAKGVRGLLYPSFAPEALHGVTPTGIHHSQASAIVSNYVYRKEHA